MANLDEENSIHAILSKQVFILEEKKIQPLQIKYLGMSWHSENFNKLSLILLKI